MIADLQTELSLGTEVGAPDLGALTVLSFGAGQESTALLYRFALDAEFRRRHAPGGFIVVGSDTGDEHPETYVHVEWCRGFCLEHQIPFFWLGAGDEFHGKTWSTLVGQYRLNATIGSARFARTCTDNLKIQPLYRFLASWLRQEFSQVCAAASRADVFRGFAQEYGAIRMVIGFALGEEKRMTKTRNAHTHPGMVPSWRRYAFKVSFPLIEELKWDRAASQHFMRSVNLPLPVPSNCLRCHFRGPVELLWLARRHPAAFEEWVALEEAKIAKNRMKGVADEQNLGVYGRRRLPEELAAAVALHGQMSMEELEEYRMSHGHCIKNGF